MLSSDEPITIKCEKLLLDDESLIFVIPSNFYEVNQKRGTVYFSDVGLQLCDSLLNKVGTSDLTEEDWSVLFDGLNESPGPTYMGVDVGLSASHLPVSASQPTDIPGPSSSSGSPSLARKKRTHSNESSSEGEDDTPVTKIRKRVKRQINDDEYDEEDDVNFLVHNAEVIAGYLDV